MAAHTKVGVGYNIQVAVDAKRKMIVEQETTNQVLDLGLLTQTAAPAREILEVETINVVADRGYFKSEDIEACEKAGCVPFVPKPQRGSSVRAGFFRKDEFKYDPERDAYICPAGQALTPIREGRLRPANSCKLLEPEIEVAEFVEHVLEKHAGKIGQFCLRDGFLRLRQETPCTLRQNNAILAKKTPHVID
jgi:Transposase DDE domain